MPGDQSIYKRLSCLFSSPHRLLLDSFASSLTHFASSLTPLWLICLLIDFFCLVIDSFCLRIFFDSFAYSLTPLWLIFLLIDSFCLLIDSSLTHLPPHWLILPPHWLLFDSFASSLTHFASSLTPLLLICLLIDSFCLFITFRKLDKPFQFSFTYAANLNVKIIVIRKILHQDLDNCASVLDTLELHNNGHTEQRVKNCNNSSVLKRI